MGMSCLQHNNQALLCWRDFHPKDLKALYEPSLVPGIPGRHQGFTIFVL